MNICFIINDWNTVAAKTETTIRLIHECVVRGHNVGILYSQNLTIRNNVTYGFIKVIKAMDKVPENIESFYKKVNLSEKLLPINGFDAIFIRKNPPVDSIMLNFLDSVKDETFLINDIHGIRKANNKLYTSLFHDPNNEFLPVTHVSKNIKYLKRIIEESDNEKMILKPLNAYGGSGVIVLEKNAQHNINSLLEFYIEGKEQKNYVIVQEYVEGAEKGDIRVLMLNGKPAGAYKRVPAEGDIRANIHAGGRAEKHKLTKKELFICNKIGPQLVADGIYFAGIDIINDKLIEVNVLSPGGIANVNRLNKTKVQKKVIDFLEDMINQRNDIVIQRQAAIERKKLFNTEIKSD
jgi:glutathione synthase